MRARQVVPRQQPDTRFGPSWKIGVPSSSFEPRCRGSHFWICRFAKRQIKEIFFQKYWSTHLLGNKLCRLWCSWLLQACWMHMISHSTLNKWVSTLSFYWTFLSWWRCKLSLLLSCLFTYMVSTINLQFEFYFREDSKISWKVCKFCNFYQTCACSAFLRWWWTPPWLVLELREIRY